MTLAHLILWIAFIINASLLVSVAFGKFKKHRGPVFLLVALIAIWQAIELINTFWLLDTPHLLLGVRFGLLPNLFLAPAFIWLVFSLFNKWKSLHFGYKFLWWLPAIVMSPIIFTNYNISEVLVIDRDFLFMPGELYWGFMVYFGIAVTYGLWFLMHQRAKANLIVKKQIDYIFAGTAVTAFVGLLFSAVLPFFGQQDLFYIGINGSVFFTLILVYALSHYKFWNLRLSLFKILADWAVLFVTIILFYFLFWLLVNVVQIDFSVLRTQVGFVLFISLVAPWLHQVIYRLANVALINPVRDIMLAEVNIADILRSSRDLNVLFSKLAKEISQVINYREIFVYLAKHNNPQAFYQVFPVGERLLNINESQLLQFLAAKSKPANQAEIGYLSQDRYLAKALTKQQIDIAVPIFYNQQLLGVLMIDNNQILLSRQQLVFLEKINKYLDIAIGSLLLANK
jgi:hypothetical protein